MRDCDKILHTSGKITLALLAFLLMFICWIGNVFSYGTQSGTLLDLRRGSRVTDYMFHQPLVNTYTMYFGTQSVTGSGTTGYITGTSTALPRLQYNASALTFNFVGATLQNEGVDVTVSSDLGSYIAVSGGTGTGNVLTNTTLAGAGTISANVSLSGNITANSLEITPAELSSVNNASSELQAQITTATGSITNHAHSGSDGTTQIAHDSITGTGTNSHATIDSFISSKAQASGLASLDGSSLVVQNPANSTATPTASKILIADGAGKIADGWLNSTVSLLGQTIALGTETTGNTDSIPEGDENKYYTDARVNSAVGSLSVSAHSDIIFTSPAEGHKLVFDASLNVVNATDTAIVAWSGITGVPTDNGSVSAASGEGYIPVGGSDGKLDAGWIPTVIRLTGTTTSPEAGAYGQLYVQSSTGAEVLGELGTNTTATMTSATTPSGIVRASSQHTSNSYLPYEAFDKILTLNERWVANSGGNEWLSYDYGTGTCYVLGQYRIASAENNANEAPNTFSMQGSNDNISWTGIDSRSGITGWVADTYKSFDIATSTTAYQFYRLYVTSDGGGGAIDVTELQLLEAIAIPYTQYSAKYDDPINGNTVFEILTPGTATAEASYIYNNATTTVWGLGTNTAITSGTATGRYAGWTNRPIHVSAVDIVSTKKIKENIMPIHIRPEQLEAESKAKPVYIADKKPAWFADNEINYTYVGSDTATYIDTAAMESDYASYIEFEWASDLNQNVYIEAVQKAQQKYFWGLFDKIQPKSWNPIDDLRMTRKGLIVEEVPDEIKGADGQSIDQMAVTTYQTLVLQELKDGVVDIMQALKDLAIAGTFTTQAIDDRLEVMRIVQ